MKFLEIALFISLGATAIVLLIGIATLFFKEKNLTLSNKLMRLRVILQGITIALFILLLLSR